MSDANNQLTVSEILTQQLRALTKKLLAQSDSSAISCEVDNSVGIILEGRMLLFLALSPTDIFAIEQQLDYSVQLFIPSSGAVLSTYGGVASEQELLWALQFIERRDGLWAPMCA